MHEAGCPRHNLHLWDDEDRLTRIASPGGSIDTFTYAADGLRRRKEPGSTARNFVWDGLNVLQELDATFSTAAEYTGYPGVPGGLVSMRRSGASSFYGADLLGNTGILVSPAGAITDAYAYKAFGEELPATGATDNPFRFGGMPGYYRQGAEPVYARWGYLNVAQGRRLNRGWDQALRGSRSAYAFGVGTPVADRGFEYGGPASSYRASYRAGLRRFDPVFGDTWPEVLTRTGEWFVGTLPERIAYGPSDPATEALRISWGGEQMRQQYVRSGYAREGWGVVSTPSAFFNTVNQPDNPHQAYTGGFEYWWRSSGTGSVTFTVENRTDTRSFFYHQPVLYRPIEWLRSRLPFKPMRPVTQVFTWTETDPPDPSRPSEGPFDPWARSYPGIPQCEGPR